MPSADRAFRALAREQPDVVLALLKRVTVSLSFAALAIEAEAVDDPHLDPPPTVDADWIARFGDEILHVEWQGYRDAGFLDRLFKYHLALFLRYDRPVRSVALWVEKPTAEQRRGEITREGVTIRFECVVLCELPAAILLADPQTACFAPAADPGDWSNQQVCDSVAQALRNSGASFREQHVAVATAAAAGRYDAMIHAMQKADLEPIVIEDLVRFGEDRGFEKGLAQGLEKGLEQGLEKGLEQGLEKGLEHLRGALLELINARGWELSDETRTRLEATRDPIELRRWIARAGRAVSADEIF